MLKYFTETTLDEFSKTFQEKPTWDSMIAEYTQTHPVFTKEVLDYLITAEESTRIDNLILTAGVITRYEFSFLEAKPHSLRNGESGYVINGTILKNLREDKLSQYKRYPGQFRHQHGDEMLK